MVFVIIVAHSMLLREGIASLLQNTRFKVVTAIPGPDQFALIRHSRARETLAVLGVDQRAGNLDQARESIRLARSLPLGKVVLLLETNAAIDLQRVLTLSPDACLININSRDVLLKALELTLVSERLFVFGNSVAIRMKQDNSDYGLVPSLSQRVPWLSQRETQILQLLAQGKSNKAIAQLSNAAEETVKVHLKAILRKTNLQNRTQAAVWAIEHGFREPSLGSRVVADPTLLPAATQTTDHDSAGGKRAAQVGAGSLQRHI